MGSMPLRKGCFLIASPEVEEGIFQRSVILLCEHSSTGSFGIVINKTLDLELPEDILPLSKFANPNVSVRAGGPVQTNQMMLLHTYKNAPKQTLEVCSDVYLGGDLQFLQEVISQEKGNPIFLCFGYAGWNNDQLEKEYQLQSWFAYPATKEYIFELSPEILWQTLLQDMGGKYATLSMIPEDLSLN